MNRARRTVPTSWLSGLPAIGGCWLWEKLEERRTRVGWEGRRRAGEGEVLRAPLEDCLPALLPPSQPQAPHLGVRKGSRAAHELQQCELTHWLFYSPIYHLLISLAQMSGGDLWPYRLGAHNLQRRIGKAHEAQKWLKGRGRSLEKAWPEESAGQASGAE